MLRALITVALVMFTGAEPAQVKVERTAAKSPDHVASDYQPSSNYDSEAEQQLLDYANQARAKAGTPPLHLDEGLTAAARAHVDVMARKKQLTHQFEGEPSLPRRLAAASPLHFDRAGENVALDMTAEQAHERLMHSPPHRENLLDASYNVAGFGVMRSGGLLFVVEDFGHTLPSYSVGQTQDTIASSVLRMRRAAGLAELTRHTDSALQSAVCSMAHEDRLQTRAMRELAQHHSVISYTNMHPEVLPDAATRLVTDRHLRSMAVSTCYARTPTYPNGVYWVGLLFY